MISSSDVVWCHGFNQVSLGKHHNFIVRKTTSAMMGTAPHRADLLAALGPRLICPPSSYLFLASSVAIHLSTAIAAKTWWWRT